MFSVHGQRNRIKIVVAFGASLDVLDDNNESPLTYGIEFKCVECIRVLLALNANATKVKLETVANDEIRQLLVAHSKKTVMVAFQFYFRACLLRRLNKNKNKQNPLGKRTVGVERGDFESN